jgi:hypothetical protein
LHLEKRYDICGSAKVITTFLKSLDALRDQPPSQEKTGTAYQQIAVLCWWKLVTLLVYNNEYAKTGIFSTPNIYFAHEKLELNMVIPLHSP